MPHGANGFTHLGDIDPAALPTGTAQPLHRGNADPTPFAIAADFAASRRPSDPVTDLAPEAENAVRILAARIAELDRDEVQVFHGLLRGLSYSQIADEIGLRSRQNVYYRVRQTIERHEWMTALRPKR